MIEQDDCSLAISFQYLPIQSASPGKESLRDCPGQQRPDTGASGVPDRHLASPDQAPSVTQGSLALILGQFRARLTASQHTAGRPCPDSEA
jgi:hypothetical protein